MNKYPKRVSYSYLACYLIFFLCSTPSYSQSAVEFDKLNDSIRVSNWSNVVGNKKLLHEIVNKTKRLGFIKQNGYASILLGYCYQVGAKQDSAIHYFRNATTIALKINDKDLECRSVGNMGNSYFYMGSYDSAIIYTFKSLKLAEEIKNYNFVSYKYGDLGNIMIRQKNPAKAVEYLQAALKYADIANNEKAKINYYNSIGSAYRELGKVPEMLSSYERGLEMAKKYNNLRSQEFFLINIASYHSDQKRTQKSIEYLKAAEEIAIRIGEKIHLATIYANLSQGYMDEKDFDNAVVYNKKAELLAKENNDKFLLSEIYLTLSLLEEKRKNYESALSYRRLNNSMKDELFSEKSQKEIENLKIKYETEKKEAAIKLLNSENALQKQTIARNQLLLLNNELELDKKSLLLGNQNLLIDNQQLELKNNQSILAKNTLELKNKEQKINILNLSDSNKTLLIQKRNRQIIFGLMVFCLLAALSYLFYNRYKLKQKARLQQAVIFEQDEAARAVIAAEENERTRMSQTLHDGLGQLLSAAKMNMQAAMEHLPADNNTSHIYMNALQLVDDSILEMRSVSHQMVTNNVVRKGLANALKELIEKIENNRLKITLDVNGLLQEIHPETQLVVYRILQESINNVIKHANADNLNIVLNVSDKKLLASITDNGKGFDTDNVKTRKGIGLDNIETRIKFLKGSYNINSSKNNGTTLQFEIPL